LVLLLDARAEHLLRRRAIRNGKLEWDVFAATVQEGQTLSEAATCGLRAALPQLAEIAQLKDLHDDSQGAMSVDSFRVPACKAEAFVFQLQDEATAALLDASEELAWVRATAAQQEASWRLRQTVSRSDFDRCLPVVAETTPELNGAQESFGGETERQAREIELLELYCGNGNHTVAMSGVFDR
jgi:hypothetical protein